MLFSHPPDTPVWKFGPEIQKQISKPLQKKNPSEEGFFCVLLFLFEQYRSPPSSGSKEKEGSYAQGFGGPKEIAS